MEIAKFYTLEIRNLSSIEQSLGLELSFNGAYFI